MISSLCPAELPASAPATPALSSCTRLSQPSQSVQLTSPTGQDAVPDLVPDRGEVHRRALLGERPDDLLGVRPGRGGELTEVLAAHAAGMSWCCGSAQKSEYMLSR